MECSSAFIDSTHIIIEDFVQVVSPPNRFQEIWLATVKEMIQDIPEVDDNDERTAQTRDAAIASLRRVIARRWSHLYELRCSLPESQWNDLSNSVTACIASLVEKNAEEIPFAPDMKVLIPEVSEYVPITKDDSPPEKSSKSISSTSSTRTCVPHEFRWLEMRHGVWTVLQAIILVLSLR